MSDNHERTTGPASHAPERIAEALRARIVSGGLGPDARLPSEQELAAEFGVSRPTIREALKRLAAQNLIRTRRGASGGTFVNRIGWAEARDQLVATATLLVSMTPLEPEAVAEARLALLTACAPMAAARREEAHLARMRAEIAVQQDPATTDEGFCASDVAFHRALADATGNPLMAFQMAGVIEAMQPLLNMLIWRRRDRAEIATGHARIADALEARDTGAMVAELTRLSDYTRRLVSEAQALRAIHVGNRTAEG
jgi:DNA-binding FadR family transcriptional regulator